MCIKIFVIEPFQLMLQYEFVETSGGAGLQVRVSVVQPNG